MASYGGLYSTSATAIAVSDETVVLPIATIMPQKNVTYGENCITVQNAGDYEITYSFTGEATTAATVTLSVKQNGRTLLPSVKTLDVDNTAEKNFNVSFFSTLVSGDALVLCATSSVQTNLLPGANVNTIFTVKQLSVTE